MSGLCIDLNLSLPRRMGPSNFALLTLPILGYELEVGAMLVTEGERIL